MNGRGKGAIETVGGEARWEAEEQRQILPSPAIKMNIILGESIAARWKRDGSQEVKYMLSPEERDGGACAMCREREYFLRLQPLGPHHGGYPQIVDDEIRLLSARRRLKGIALCF
jgi:hypothetical protein